MSRALERLYASSPAWLQALAVSAYGWKIRRERFGPEYRRWQRVFADNERRSPAELAAMQDESVRTLVAHAFEKVPYYRDVMRERRLGPDDIRGVADLRKLPILTKAILFEQTGRLCATGLRPADLREAHSSGTTGSPVTMFWDRRVSVANNACNWRARLWAGLAFGTPYASLLGRTIVPIGRDRPPFWRWNAPWSQLLLSSFHLHEQNLPAYIDAMKAHGCRFLEAYPSTAYVLARHLVDAGTTLPLDGVVCSSETLLPVQRATIEQAFACRVFDVFSQSERVLFAMECEKHDGLHLQVEFGALEIVGDDGEPVPEGHFGRIIATGLQNYGMPLIRYEVGDVSALITAPCACGRPFQRMASVTTKAEDIVVTPEGRFVSSSTLTHPFKPMVRIEKSQIVQEAPDRVVVKIVRRPGYTDADTRILVAALAERLGPSVTIDIQFVEDIPRGPSGKFRWVISKVPLHFSGSDQANLYE